MKLVDVGSSKSLEAVCSKPCICWFSLSNSRASFRKFVKCLLDSSLTTITCLFVTLESSAVRSWQRERISVTACRVQVSMSLMHLPSTISLFFTASDFFCESRSASFSFSLDLFAFSTNPVDIWSLCELCLHLAQIGNRQGSSQKRSSVESEW